MRGKQFDFYARQYALFSSEVASAIRRDVYGEDFGQTGWRDAGEQRRIAELLLAAKAGDVLDVACGSGGPSLALVQAAKCRLIGVDIEPAGIDAARRLAADRGLDRQARFETADCNRPLPFGAERFDAVVCVDAILHLGDRSAALADWARMLRPGGRVVFADAGVLTGPVTREEIVVRAMQGPFTLVPPETNEAAVAAAGLALCSKDDTTESVAKIAAGLRAARERRAPELRAAEGSDWFSDRQRFLEATATLAATGRLSRYLYVAEKPSR